MIFGLSRPRKSFSAQSSGNVFAQGRWDPIPPPSGPLTPCLEVSQHLFPQPCIRRGPPRPRPKGGSGPTQGVALPKKVNFFSFWRFAPNIFRTFVTFFLPKKMPQRHFRPFCGVKNFRCGTLRWPKSQSTRPRQCLGRGVPPTPSPPRLGGSNHPPPALSSKSLYGCPPLHMSSQFSEKT